MIVIMIGVEVVGAIVVVIIGVGCHSCCGVEKNSTRGSQWLGNSGY